MPPRIWKCWMIRWPSASSSLTRKSSAVLLLACSMFRQRTLPLDMRRLDALCLWKPFIY
ncbi:hypothetical protein H113_02743 [Trichophyton rubrum MR1459]|uniref:Uncharacterized protein n=1 Tax=Trichophyton soudanense CBS 452.61 TaxID=1215331 RepID=A0A022XYJ1_TRISD|nr:hypothetical protein H102_02731 [Trichophyton rubrum CBS 100081]EZF65130.1 hypothetical protein H104_02721 [Trichophyton rubrum CBS 289.86]EZF75797.1 hypothetical protein H105_02748 [Trichophyton soudanense CBS 452.61]EZF97218.1 hypothetical protein H113_02743 [Trichophyton rubrum MR1459]EZG18710.1 hypothetical protein H107_02817 [Trichophyton rubrum CBS 202.88]